ncbi:type 1 fimbria pilin [Paraburkholderia youngii]|uniref:hypothetical protein n=1 Tax=Paraburkholderia youngii TaxID=2782701 RepID=UPI003D233510
MKAETMRWRTFGRTAAVVALLAAPLAAPAASTVTGGVIRFVGMIVAPPLQISADTAPTGVAVDSASVAGQRFSRTVTFSAPPGVVSGADVALEVNGSTQSRDLVAASFVDGTGHGVPARDGHYAVDRAGGMLSLNARRTDTDTRVTVVVSYD